MFLFCRENVMVDISREAGDTCSKLTPSSNEWMDPSRLMTMEIVKHFMY